MKSYKIHQQAMDRLGIGEYNKLILDERAHNQKHWAGKFIRVLISNGKPKEKLKYIQEIADKMYEEAERYEELLDE